MKKIIFCLMATCFLLAFYPFQLKAADKDVTSSVIVTKSVESAKAQTLVLRLNEIKAMDRSVLTLSEKKDLRKEVRSIKGQLRDIGGGVYISASALILILILLILLT